MLRFTWLVVHLLAQFSLRAAEPAAPAPVSGNVGTDGLLTLSAKSADLCSFNPGVFEKGWKGAGSAPVKAPLEEHARRFAIHTSTGAIIDGAMSCENGGEAGAKFTYEFTPQADVELNTLHVSADFPVAALAGGTWDADGARGVFPADFKDISLHNGPTKLLALELPGGQKFSFKFDSPIPVLLQDNRKWGPTFSIRIGPQADGKLFKKGEKQTIAFAFTVNPSLSLDFDAPVTITAGPDWIPLTLEQDIEPGSALDFSALGFQDAPAGKHGRVIASPGNSDGHFAFKDSPEKPQRFYGINLCFSAQFLTHEQSDKLAERLMRLGYNALRIHHYEHELTEGQPDSTTLNPQKIEQLDFLFAALKLRGLYMTTDLFVSRPVKWKDLRIDKPGDVPMDTFKILVPVLPAAFENWKAFSKSLLDHTNPYTKLRYADDPALAWLSLINEGMFGNFLGEVRKIPQWEKAWNAWLLKKYPTRDKLAAAWGVALLDHEDQGVLQADLTIGNVALPDNLYAGGPREADCIVFFADVDREMVAKMKTFLREELKCEALLTNSNAWTNFAATQLSRETYDYVDDHFYVDHPHFLEKPWQLPARCENTSPVAAGAPGGRNCAFTRLYGKPFTITEYNYAGPARHRGIGGMLTGALAALQDWSGVWRFGYSHNRANLFQPAPMGNFDMASDPLSQASERAALCLFLREDLHNAPASHLLMDTEKLRHLSPMPNLAPSWSFLAWITRVNIVLFRDEHIGTLPLDGFGIHLIDYYKTPGSEVIDSLRAKQVLGDPAKRIFRTFDNQLMISGPENLLLIDTQKTAGGFAAAGKAITTADHRLSIDVVGADATVWLSALDDKPLTESNRILLTHLTDLQNTDIHYAEKACKTLLSWGKLPHLVREGKATVRLKRADADKLKVWALSTSGKRAFEVKTSAADGAFTFTVDVADHAAESGAHFCYEIAK